MASTYGPNFGFRRSDESMASGTEGRQRVPATGTYKIGELVELDPAAPGFIKRSAADAPIEPGFRGLLIQEDQWDVGVHENQVLMTQDHDRVINGNLCAIWTGAGLKIWLRNTPERAAGGGRARVRPARTIVAGDLTAIAVGDFLGWNGTAFAKVASKALAVARVTLRSGTDYLEATLLA